MKKLFILIFLCAMISGIRAQDNFFGITYNTAVPLGASADYIDKYSWGAMGLEWKKMVNDNVGVGLNLSWQVFSQKIEHGTIVRPETNLTVTGTQLRYLNYFPMTITGTYHFNPEGKVIPFVGGGAGLYRVLQRFDISGFAFQDDTWNFGFYPEVGLMIPTGGSADFFINSKYHYIFAVKDHEAHSFLNFNVGFSYFY